MSVCAYGICLCVHRVYVRVCIGYRSVCRYIHSMAFMQRSENKFLGLFPSFHGRFWGLKTSSLRAKCPYPLSCCLALKWPFSAKAFCPPFWCHQSLLLILHRCLSLTVCCSLPVSSVYFILCFLAYWTISQRQGPLASPLPIFRTQGTALGILLT